MQALLLVAGLIAGTPAPGYVVVNNGLAPPNPANVFDASNSYPDDTVYVQNLGCNRLVEPVCPVPWGDPTSVALVSGGHMSFVGLFESSTLTMSGGRAVGLGAFDSSMLTHAGGRTQVIDAWDFSTVTVAGGTVEVGLSARGSSTVTMTGGEVSEFLGAGDSSTLTLHDGVVGEVSAGGSSVVTIHGGSMQTLFAFSTVTMTGGEVQTHAWARSGSFTLDGGTVLGGLTADGAAAVTVNDGAISGVAGAAAFDMATLTVNGGVVSGLGALGSSTVALHGGRVTGDAYARGDEFAPPTQPTLTIRGGMLDGVLAADCEGTLRVVGTGFAVDGVPVPDGDLHAPSGTLTGTLESGEIIDSTFSRTDCTGLPGTEGTITVPEPGAIPLLLLGGLLLASSTRRGPGAPR